ncbi:hypothetical protein DFH28DRAFT_928193 [Melampsora americana]|nr:hypothetical protein DFH28DRAFT_928193 [Melampsora americana]
MADLFSLSVNQPSQLPITENKSSWQPGMKKITSYFPTRPPLTVSRKSQSKEHSQHNLGPFIPCGSLALFPMNISPSPVCEDSDSDLEPSNSMPLDNKLDPSEKIEFKNKSAVRWAKKQQQEDSCSEKFGLGVRIPNQYEGIRIVVQDFVKLLIGIRCKNTKNLQPTDGFQAWDQQRKKWQKCYEHGGTLRYEIQSHHVTPENVLLILQRWCDIKRCQYTAQIQAEAQLKVNPDLTHAQSAKNIFLKEKPIEQDHNNGLVCELWTTVRARHFTKTPDLHHLITNPSVHSEDIVDCSGQMYWKKLPWRSSACTAFINEIDIFELLRSVA